MNVQKDETYTCEELLSLEDLPQLISVEHHPSDLLHLFSQDDILEVCGVHKELCVQAEYLSEKKMRKINLPLTYPGGVKHLSNFEYIIPTAESLKKMFIMYASRHYKVTRSRALLPKDTIIEIVDYDNNFLHVKHQNEMIKIPLGMNCDFIEVPTNELVSMKKTVEEYLLPRWVRFADVTLLKSIYRKFDDINHNFRLLNQIEQKVLLCKVHDNMDYPGNGKVICFPCDPAGNFEFKFKIVPPQANGLIDDKKIDLESAEFYDFVLALNENCSISYTNDDKGKNAISRSKSSWKTYIPPYVKQRIQSIKEGHSKDLPPEELCPEELNTMSMLKQPFLRSGSPTELDSGDEEVNNDAKDSPDSLSLSSKGFLGRVKFALINKKKKIDLENESDERKKGFKEKKSSSEKYDQDGKGKSSIAAKSNSAKGLSREETNDLSGKTSDAEQISQEPIYATTIQAQSPSSPPAMSSKALKVLGLPGISIESMDVTSLVKIFQDLGLDNAASIMKEHGFDGAVLMASSEEDLSADPLKLEGLDLRKVMCFMHGWRPKKRINDRRCSSDMSVEHYTTYELQEFLESNKLMQIAQNLFDAQVDGELFCKLTENDFKLPPLNLNGMPLKKAFLLSKKHIVK